MNRSEDTSMPTNDTPASPATRSDLRLRFSLATMLMLLIIATLIGSNLFTSWHLQNARQTVMEQQAEIEQYQDQLGILRVTDETKTHIIAIDTLEQWNWRWRIFVPQGKTYRVRSAFGDIHPSGFPYESPPTLDVSYLEPGETLLTISLGDGPDYGKFRQRIRNERNGATSYKYNEFSLEAIGAHYSGHLLSGLDTIGPEDGQSIFLPEKRIELVRYRVWEAPQEGIDFIETTEPSAGILLWLEPVKDSTSLPAAVP